MSFLGLENKTVIVTGVANRKSVAYAVGQTLTREGADVVYVVRDTAVRDAMRKRLEPATVLTCDVEREEEIAALADELHRLDRPVAGLVHSIAFANYSDGFCPFHETEKQDFLQAMDISCFSLIALARAVQPLLAANASIVTLSISTTRMAAMNYGYMAPVKAALDSTVVFLANSLSQDREIRVNAVGAGLLKTSASAGIPGYIDSYLYAEQVIPRRRCLATQEAADAVVFLLSPRAGGINAQTLVVDAGMSINYFDRRIVRAALKGLQEE